LNSLQAIAIGLSIGLLSWAILISRRYLVPKNPSRNIDMFFALATLVGLLIGYHTFAYDLILLAVPLLSLLDLALSEGFDWRRELPLLMPPGLLLLAPLYILLLIKVVQLNLLALVLLAWVYAIQEKIKEQIEPELAGMDSTNHSVPG
jgi:hypothetical protein